MTEIEALLARLKELDPETWSEWRYVYRGNWEGADYEPGVRLERTDLWLLQGVIQEAITARGWFFSLTYLPTDKKSDVKIRDRGFVEGRGIWPLLSHIGIKGHAEALLAAYIAALEAEREAGR